MAVQLVFSRLTKVQLPDDTNEQPGQDLLLNDVDGRYHRDRSESLSLVWESIETIDPPMLETVRRDHIYAIIRQSLVTGW
jgi:hypothetical protein